MYDVPAEAVSEGYNLIEVNAKQDLKITWVEISVPRSSLRRISRSRQPITRDTSF